MTMPHCIRVSALLRNGVISNQCERSSLNKHRGPPHQIFTGQALSLSPIRVTGPTRPRLGATPPAKAGRHQDTPITAA
jgi:hypothetical protein